MPQLVEIEGVGNVEFPDDATQAEIVQYANKQFPKTRTGTNAPASPPHIEEADVAPAPIEASPVDPSKIKLDAYQESFLRTGLLDPSRVGEGEFTKELVTHLPSDISNVARGITADIAAGFRALGTGPTEASQYSGNIVAALQREDMPIDKVLRDISPEAPGAATIGKISQGIAATAPMAAIGALPKALQTAALIGFTGKMISDAPGVATALGDELGKPKDQQNPDKITSLVSDAIQITGFSMLGGKAIAKGTATALGAHPDPVLAAKAEAIRDIAPLTSAAIESLAVEPAGRARGLSPEEQRAQNWDKLQRRLSQQQLEALGQLPIEVQSVLAERAGNIGRGNFESEVEMAKKSIGPQEPTPTLAPPLVQVPTPHPASPAQPQKKGADIPVGITAGEGVELPLRHGESSELVDQKGRPVEQVTDESGAQKWILKQEFAGSAPKGVSGGTPAEPAPIEKGKENALESETAQSVRNVREQPIQSQSEVSTPGSGTSNDEGGGEASPPETPQASVREKAVTQSGPALEYVGNEPQPSTVKGQGRTITEHTADIAQGNERLSAITKELRELVSEHKAQWDAGNEIPLKQWNKWPRIQGLEAEKHSLEQRVSELVAKDRAIRNEAAETPSKPAIPGKPTALLESPQSEATTKSAEAKAGDVSHLLNAEVPSDVEPRARVREIDVKQAELRDQYKPLESEIKEIEKVIKPQRGNAYARSKIKASAKRSDVERYRSLKKQQADIESELRALDEKAREDRRLIDQSIDAKIINDPSQPLLRRIDRKIRSMEGEAPPELLAARDAESARIIKEKYPDATPEEIKHIRPELERSAYFGEDPWKSPNVPDVQSLRRAELDAAINAPGVSTDAFSEELLTKLRRFRVASRVGRHEAPVEPLTAKDVAGLKGDIAKETKRAHAARVAETQRLEAEKKAEQDKEDKLLADAQKVVDSAKRNGRSPKEVKEDLVARIKSAISEMLEKDSVKLTQREDGSYTAASDGQAAVGTIEPTAGGKFKVTAWPIQDAESKLATTVSTKAEAEWVIQAMASTGTGRAIIAVPGDGIYKLLRHGPTLLGVWADARKIETSGTTKYNPYKSYGGTESPPKKIATLADWKNTKEFHGLEGEETISSWSPALAEVAKKIDAKHPEKVTTKDVDAWLEERKSGKPPKAKQEAEPEVEPYIPGESFDPFSVEDKDLHDYFESRQSEVEQRGSAGKYTFSTYEEFRDWMNDRYGERDLDGMREAFTEASSDFKVKFIKENKAEPEHKKAWIRNMATGSPLPTEDPPITRTTPRPMPGTWQAPPPGATGPQAGARPPGYTPPPPPRPAAPTMPTSPTPVGSAGKVRASDIIKDMAEAMDRPIRIGHVRGPNLKSASGIFKAFAEVARIRRANDIPTAAHEMAHGLERMHRRALGNGTDIGRAAWTRQLPADVKTELQGLDYNPLARRAYEGFAEFLRHWLTLRDTATIAPKSHAWFENTFLQHDPELKTALGDLQTKIQDYQNQGAVSRVESMLRFEGEQEKKPLRKRLSEAKGRFLTLWSDDLRPMEQVEKEMNSGEIGLGTQSPTKIARAITQAAGTKARVWAKFNMTDFSGNPTGPGLKQIFSKEGIKGDERNAIIYAVAKRAQELHGRKIDPGISIDDANETVRQLKTPEREQFSKDLREWNDGLMDYLLDAGSISRETFDRVSSLNQAYVPFFRVFEEESAKGFASGGRRIGDTPRAIHAIKGSGREIRDPIEGMLNYAQQVISVADKTRLARSLVELSEKKAGLGRYVEKIPPSMIPVEFDINRIAKQLEHAGADLSQADLDAVMTLFQNSPRTPTGGNIVAFVRNGQRQFYELHPELYRVIQAMDYHQIHPLLNILLGKASRSVRMGATGVRVGFAIWTNPVHDFVTQLIQSHFNPVTASVKWAQHLGKQFAFRDQEIKNFWRATGGELSQPLGMDRASLRREIGEVLANSPSRVAWHIIRHPIEFAREALSFTEAVPRLAEWEMTARQMGWTPGQPMTPDIAIEAANRSAEVTVNFRRAGAWGRSVNQAVAFFNPSIQGLSKFSRTVADHPIRAAATGIGFITAPALLNWWANKDDKKWQNLPAWAKYGFITTKIGGEFVRFPMPFEWWYAFGALPVSLMNALHEHKPKEVKDAFQTGFDSLKIPLIPSVATPLIEAQANKSFFTGRPIVPRSVQELVPQEQVQPYTSTTSRKVSQILSHGGVDVAPAKIDHVLNGETGGLWTDIVGLAERAGGVGPSKALLEPADLPIAGRLFVRDSSSAVIDEFYTELQHLSAKENTYNKLHKQHSDRASMYRLSAGEHVTLNRLHSQVQTMAQLRKDLNAATTRDARKRVIEKMESVSRRTLGIQ